MTTTRARTLRKRLTPAEARMWNLLRTEHLKPYHFRRQVPFGPYYADFASHGARLVLEIDGDTHGTDEQVAYDARRTTFLRGEGYRVIRFANADVLRNLDGVFHALSFALAPPDPAAPGHPPHEGEGGTRLTRPDLERESQR